MVDACAIGAVESIFALGAVLIPTTTIVPPSDSKEYACSQVLTVASGGSAAVSIISAITDIDDIQGLKGLHLRKDFISGFQVRKLHRPCGPQVSPRRSLCRKISDILRGFYILLWRSRGCGGQQAYDHDAGQQRRQLRFLMSLFPPLLAKISPFKGACLSFRTSFRGSDDPLYAATPAGRPEVLRSGIAAPFPVSAAPSLLALLIQYPSGGGISTPCLAGQQPCLPRRRGPLSSVPQLLRIQNLLIGLLRQDPHVPLDLRPGGQI